MRTELFWPLAFCGFAAVSLVCGIVAWPMLSAAWPSIEAQIDRFRRLPPLAKVVLLLFVGAFFVYGSTKTNQIDQTSGTNIIEIVDGGTNVVEIVEGGTNGVGEIEFEGGTNDVEIADGGETNAPPPMLMMAMPFSGDQPPTVTPEDIARGWQLWEVRTNSNISYTMPEGAVLSSNWWVRGAYEDVKLFDFGSWRFPFGTNEYSSLWAFSWGKVRFALADTNTEIVAVGAPMSAVPYRSRLWSAADTNDSRFVTWENFVLGRASVADYQLPSTNYQLVSAQIELAANGDFIARSNEVETVYRRVDPEDWDGDGWRNDDDYNPYSWDDCNDDFYQELPYDADTNAYCWIEVRPEWNTWIDFQGDGWSNLSDPYFTARAGKTYRVWLLIGKTYSVFAQMPVSVVGRSDDRIEITDVTENSFTAVWPVTFTVAEGRAPTGRPRLGATWNDGGKSFYVMPNPSWLRGAVTWTDNYCCDVWGDGTNFTYACDNSCTCEGCTVYGSYWYEGYGLPVNGIPCGCHYVPDHGPVGVSISFDRPAVIYEDVYTNLPGEVVHPVRSNAVLRCSVSGGTYGGTFSVTLNEAAQQKLRKVRGNTLPQNVRIEPGSSRSYEVVYSVLEPSGSEGDIGAEAIFQEDFRNKTHTNNASMTAVKVELTADKIALLNLCQQRHTYGVGEAVSFANYPSDVDSSWQIVMNGEQAVMSVGYTDVFYCPLSNATGVAAVTINGVSYSTQLTVVEPEIEIRNVRANDRFSDEAKMWDPTLVDVNPVVGESGHLLLFLDRYAAPYYVSFEGLQFVEIPDESHNCPHDGQGYYADEARGGPLSHTQLAGAGKWRPANSQAFFGTDAAGTREAYSQPWMDGWKSWPIPMGWGYGADVLGRFRNYPTFQTYTLSSDGTFRIDKFDHWAERNTLGMVWVDGSLQLSPWPW